ncbi:S8 family serine peptidase [Calothrix sp. PCC 6303]|uniref:S8 family serine peptidase n=1 Tax=Calothrix sp. PCC 6303 TaxID=1170562 RepID=UPI0002A01B35|nr:S8 family serine peptidase [Calothrix sp. PCC 6303]AFZ01039.1 peptidase S8 and S53 subtilisin kexin sedolisin [Calothrix sp. PCC 6303]
MVQITINGISIDPEAQSQAMNASNLISPDSSNSNYILVQTVQPLNSEQKSQLAALGAEILEFVPENTYVCRYNPENLDAVRNLAFVDWANVYLEGFKIPPQLRDSSINVNKGNLISLSNVNPKLRMTRKPQAVTLVLHNNITLDEGLRSRIATAARLNAEELPLNTKSLRLSIQPQYLDDLAKIDEVRHIEEYVTPQLCNNVAVKVINADKTHSIAKFEGEGQVVAVADTGFDKGSTEDVHPAFTGRVLKLYPLGQRRAADPDGHGTHVCGSVLGDGVSETMGGPIRGAAPKAKLIVQSLLDMSGGLGGIPDDLNTLFKEPYENDGARVHTNSWGASTRGGYNILCSQVDQFVWEHRDMVICFAAGNDGRDKDMNGVIDTGSVGAPGTSKNCISVGASENNRPEQSQPYSKLQRYKTEPIASDGWSDNPEGIAAFSSRGPTKNERIKPDVVAPGTAILSAYSRDAKIDPMFGKSDDPLYAFLAGTSMATPLVAGCAAVVREYLQKQENQPQPSAALVKALLINGAKDITGQYVPSDAGDIPNFSEGFGRVDLAASTAPLGEKERVIFQDEKTALDTQQEEKIEVEIAECESTLKVTLVWTDYPGEALQNDLDLIVKTADAQERHGNVAPTSSEFDRRNNVEQIVWNNIPVGKVEIIVHAYRILHPQSYALVARVS